MLSRFVYHLLAIGCLWGTSLRAVPPQVQSVLDQHCLKCHGPEKQKAQIRFDTLSSDFVADRAAAEMWHDALNVVSTGEMPPEDEPELSADERQAFTAWVRGQLDAAITATHGQEQGVVLRRLNNAEYRYTMTDLLGVPGDYGAKLPPDTLSADGFANHGGALKMSALQLESYLEAARAALNRVLVRGGRPDPFTEESTEPAKKTVMGMRPGNPSAVLGRTGYFGMVVAFPPKEQDFTVRVTARVEAMEGKPLPVMRVQYGHKAPGAIPIVEVLGELALDSVETKTYVFRGNGRDFPNAKDLGDKWHQILAVQNVLDDGEPLPKEIKNEKGRKTGYEVDPEFPKIVVEKLEFISNDYPEWPPPHHERILFASQDAQSPDYVREVLRLFLSRAWRRPVSEPEVDRYFAHFQVVEAQSPAFIDAIVETLAVALTSANFLYLVEPEVESTVLDAYEVASRLSYLLWSSMPDSRLFELAATNALLQPVVLQAEVNRMLEDAKAERFVREFTSQWLDLGGVERVAVNPQFYPDFENELKADMVQETQAFFGEILRSNASALQFLEADWTMVNASLAKHYGLSGPQSQSFERVSLGDTGRPGGLLGHAAMHLANSNGEDSHPINRAVWIRERLLHDPPLPPPPNVPALDSTDPDFAKLSIREQLALHREDPACADCHAGLDPWGIALDHYDAVGLYREEIRRPGGKRGQFQKVPVDAKATLPGGVEVDGLGALQTYLVTQRHEQFAHALVSKLLTYALGRSLDFTDEPVVVALTQDFVAHDHQLPALLRALVVSEPFLTR